MLLLGRVRLTAVTTRHRFIRYPQALNERAKTCVYTHTCKYISYIHMCMCPYSPGEDSFRMAEPDYYVFCK